MTGHDHLRRRLLAGTGALFAAGLVGGLGVIRRPSASNPSGPDTAGTLEMSTPSAATDPSVATVTTTSTSRPPQPASTAPHRSIEVICRHAWGARPPGDGLRSHEIERLTLHHTAAPLVTNADTPSRARSSQAFHQGEGFADLAYHFLVDGNGTILEGRSAEFAGETFTSYDPTGHLLVCCEGNYNEQDPTAAQLAALADLFTWAAQAFSVDPASLGGHRDYAATSCPGDRLFGLVADGTLGGMIGDRIATRFERIDTCGSGGIARIEAIEAGA
jgi:hypothetical protein